MHSLQKNYRRILLTAKKYCFEGDGYSDEWHHEAERRGLPNLKTTPGCAGCNGI